MLALQTAAHNVSVDSGMGIPVSANHIFLKPGAKERSKSEVLLVIDFVSKVVENEDEKVLVDSNGTKLYLKGGPRDPHSSLFRFPSGLRHQSAFSVSYWKVINLGTRQKCFHISVTWLR